MKFNLSLLTKEASEPNIVDTHDVGWTLPRQSTGQRSANESEKQIEAPFVSLDHRLLRPLYIIVVVLL